MSLLVHFQNIETNSTFFLFQTTIDIYPPSAISKSSSSDDLDPDSTSSLDDFEWKLYQLNPYQLPSFMSRIAVKKIYFIGNAVRLLRYMLRDEYDSKAVYELFSHSPIQLNYDTMKKFVYKNVESYGMLGGTESELGEGGCPLLLVEEERFFFEHPLVDDFDLLLDSYYEVINEVGTYYRD